MQSRVERGAAAVEMALVLPILVALVMGIIDFGYSFWVQGNVAGAAREGARYHAIHNDSSQAVAIATGLVPAGVDVVDISATPASCSPGSDAVLTITYQVESVSGFFAALLGGVQVDAEGVMRCGG